MASSATDNWAVKRASIRMGLAILLLVLSTAAFSVDFPLTGMTESGRYRVFLEPPTDGIPISEIHNWNVRVETRDGKVFSPARIGLNAGMPSHGHGMVTEARVTQQLDDGTFIFEGMQFHMGGEWLLIVGVEGADGLDTVGFVIEISTGVKNVDAALNQWSAAEIAVMQSLTISRLKPTQDPSNRFSGNMAAVELGGKLFFDTRMSADGSVSCATCHKPALAFTDGLEKSFGTAQTNRNAPTLIGASHNRWFYWDGRRDSLWAQAITPPESPGEMDNNRTDIVRLIANEYAGAYAAVTGTPLRKRYKFMPKGAGPFSDSEGKSAWERMSNSDRGAINTVYANVGKFLAAYIETLQPQASRFDKFVAALADDGYPAARELLSRDEQRGLKLFLDGARTQCLRCHNGPLFTNYGFHNIATGESKDGIPDFGRMIGLEAAQRDPFNCLGAFSDAKPDECSELRYASRIHPANGAFKVPTLRNVADTGPYMHDGRFATLEEVVEFYTEVPGPEAGEHELLPLKLTDEEIRQLAVFLRALADSA